MRSRPIPEFSSPLNRRGGLDVAATRYVLDQLVAARANNRAVLLFSSDLDHVLSLADRVLVLFKGHVAASLDTRTATRDDLGRYMAGVEPVVSSAARAEVQTDRGEIDTDG